MNYSEFYKTSKTRLTEALVSMWASGHLKEQECLRELLEEKEPLIAEPVFQTIFPWEPAKETFEEHSSKLGILDKDFVEALSSLGGEKADFCFPADRHPYTHQSESWKAMLRDHKTIAVTSGTGSGKTECFIIPVLQDLYRQRCRTDFSQGIQAIFLYPLNALMKNQRERIDAWCSALPKKIEYAIYNGEMDDREREKMRNNPPQILFTNPTMLNYMLVRAKDQSLLEQSQGKLRWILLDEAHTYSGSSATELALQIRRVIEAFGVTLNDVNFAVTSATMGGKDAEQKLKTIVAQLTGKDVTSIQVINGNRIIPEMDDSILQDKLQQVNQKFGINLSNSTINNLRLKLNESAALTAKEIAIAAGLKSDLLENQLALIDDLSTEVIDLGGKGKNLAMLPTRAHFFIRSINGVYACVNPDCKGRTAKSLNLGSFTTYQNTKCPHCGGNMVEVANCADCGEFLIVGERNTDRDYHLRTNDFSLDYNPFEIDSLDLENEEEGEDIQKNHDKSWSMFIYGMPQKTNPRNLNPSYFTFDTEKQKILSSEKPSSNNSSNPVYQALLDPNSGKDLCPCCGVSLGKKLAFLRTGSTLLGRILASTILNNASPMSAEERSKDSEILYEGRKYITFTDSRQGTAKFSMSLNQDVERNWVRSFLYHHLAELRRNKSIPHKLDDKQKEEYEGLKKMGTDIPPFLRPRFEELQSLVNGSCTPDAEPISWPEIKTAMEANADLTRLFRYLKNARWNTAATSPISNSEKSGFLDAMFLDQFGWIPRNSNSLENLGLIHVVYPTLADARIPEELGPFGFTDSDWRDYLKICVDYQIRGGKHYDVPSSAKAFLMQQAYAKPIYDAESNLEKVTKWPCLNTENKLNSRQPKLILLLMAAMGLKSLDELTIEKQNLINAVLQKAWIYIRDNVLQLTDETNKGYKLNLLDKSKVAIQILETGWKCPVDSVVIDTLFRGYSPRLRGYATADNFNRFKIETAPMTFPYFPYANGKKISEDNSKVDISREEVIEWIYKNWNDQKEQGVLNNLHTQILYPTPIFMAGEHSAQQQTLVLENYEKSFNKGHLNILSCSTTMEMGVDLKGISAVIMNSVPPKPANYQQRAGRAGRRGETKALTLTFCTPNPIGIHAWQNPIWPLQHKTDMPDVKLTSPQIVQKHINALLFEKYVQNDGGMGIRETIAEFFEPHHGHDNFCNYLLKNLSSNDKDLENSHKSLTANTCLSNQTLTESIKASYEQIESVYSIYSDRKVSLSTSLDAAQQCGNTVRRAIEDRLKNFNNTNLLTYLAEHNFLPSAGIPTGLVEFNTSNKDSAKDSDKFKKTRKPTQHLSQAISMYTPGKQVVINNWCYESKGISMKSKFEEAKRNIIQSCSKCGYTQIVYGTPLTQCPSCQANAMHGLKREDNVTESSKFTEIIEPAGFSVDWNSSQPTQIIKTENSLSMVQPLLLQMEPWTIGTSGAKVALRTSTDTSEILFYNNGTHKSGFMLCPYCGRMESESDETAFQKFFMHKHLETGGECEGAGHEGNRIRRHVLLVGRYQTDFVELKFFDQNNVEIKNIETLYSLGVIISRKLSEYLGINDGEIDFGYSNKFNSIFIYDTALGGAGYSTLLRDYKNEVFDLARKSLQNCTCERACTKCLVDRKSQWYLNDLNRINALQWLEMEYQTRNAPAEIREVFPEAETITTDWGTEFYKICRNNDVKTLKIFVDKDYSKWNSDSFLFNHQIEMLNARSVKSNLVISSQLDFKNANIFNLTRILPLLYRNNFECGVPSINDLTPILGVEFKDGHKKIYFGKDISILFDSSWGNGTIYSATYQADFDFEPLRTDSLNEKICSIDEGMFDFKINNQHISASTLFEEMHLYKSNKWDIADKALSTETSVDISYADRFVNTPLGCIILSNLIKSIIERWSLQPKTVKLYLAPIRSNYIYGKNDFDSDFATDAIRDKFLKKYFTQIVGFEPDIITNNTDHPRSLWIKGTTYTCEIRPDGGVAWGWVLDNQNGSIKLQDVENNPNQDIKLYNIQYRKGILYTIGWEKHN